MRLEFSFTFSFLRVWLIRSRRVMKDPLNKSSRPVGEALMLRYAAITGWGHHVPNQVLTNRDLEARIDTTDDWIWTRTGIRERRIAAANETTSSLCIEAARRALACAHLSPDRLDLVICAT